MGTLVLAGRYEIIEKIGDGGMAVVYKARDKQLNRFVAIKILKKEFITDQIFVENFIREAKAAASLLHPNIVTIYDAGKDRDIYYIVMEYVEGRALSEVITAEAPLDYKRCIRIAKQIASALSLAHRNNIIHRDVKPHNILITQDGTAKITDFGIAKAVSDGTIINDSGVIMGSVHYFSPEQSRGQYVDEKSDIYSLGIVLYEMITGRVPFDADNPVTIAVMHMNDTIIPPSRLVRGVPPGLDQIVLKATAKYQSDRFRTIDEMYKALDNVNFITGIIDDPEIAGYVQPAVIVAETPGQGYSAAAEPPSYFEPAAYAAAADAPDYGSSGKTDAAYDDDLYDDEEQEEKPGFFAALFGGPKDGDGAGAEGQGKLTKKQRWILIIAIAAVAIVLSIPLSRVIMDMFAVDPVEVPTVVGLYEQEATDKLTAAGFSVKIERVPLPEDTSSSLPAAGEDVSSFSGDDLTTPPPNDPASASGSGEQEFLVGQVMEQDPEGGELAPPGTEVSLKVAAAPMADPGVGDSGDSADVPGEPTTVPNLVGMTKANATYAATQAGFKLQIGYENSELAIDQVISQSPKRDEMAPKNSAINIVISLGPQETSVTVPKFIGGTVEGANKIAGEHKLSLKLYEEFRGGEAVDQGKIFAQDPVEGTKVKQNSVVTIAVNLGPVPNVIGQTEANAKAALEKAGLKYKNGGTKPVTDATQAGKVVEQGGRTGVPKGSTITCVYGELQETPKYTLTVVGGNGGGSYEAGAQASISANVPAGQEFTNWTTSGGGSFATVHSASTTFTMPAGNVTVTANFKPLTQYSVTVTNGTGGGLYTAGASVTITASPAPEGQVFSGWSISGVSGVDTSPSSITFTMPAGPVSATANYTAAPAPPPEGGTP